MLLDHLRAAVGVGRRDLSESLDFTLWLMDEPREWRQRVIERASLGRGDHVRQSSSFQIDFPSDVVNAFRLRSGSAVNVIVPLTTREKVPLLRFDVSAVNATSPTLLPRRSIAAIQAEYLRRLAETSPGGNVTDLYERGVGLGPFDAVRYTSDTLALYTAQSERPAVVTAAVRLRTAPDVGWSLIAATILTAASTLAIATVSGGENFAEKLTLLTLPASVVGAIVFVRERTELATQLIARRRLWLAAMLILLWGAVIIRVASEGFLPEVEDIANWCWGVIDEYVRKHY